jgi:hypothetical protein
MYSTETISLIKNRIGFGLPLEEGFSIELDEANSVGTSGREFKSFHPLVTIENILAGLPTFEEEPDEKINTILEGYRKSATLEVLPLILDKHKDYVYDQNYDSTITNNITLFDDAVGYKVAMMVLEMLLTTKESNIVERNAKLSASNLKLELEGFKNEYGALVASGLVQKFNQAIVLATRKIFPFEIKVNNGNSW